MCTWSLSGARSASFVVPYLLNHYCSIFAFCFAVCAFFFQLGSLARSSIPTAHSFSFCSIKIVLFICLHVFFRFLFLWLISVVYNCFRPFWFTCWTCIPFLCLKNCKYLLLLFYSLSFDHLTYSKYEEQKLLNSKKPTTSNMIFEKS